MSPKQNPNRRKDEAMTAEQQEEEEYQPRDSETDAAYTGRPDSTIPKGTPL